MEKELLKAKIFDWMPDAVFDETCEWLNIEVNASSLHALASYLRYNKMLDFNFLFCLTCIDWKSHLTMVYHLTSTTYRHSLVLKSKLNPSNPEIESLTGIWQTANFHEREVYEMFGVKFINHPDLRLLILPDGWEGKNPLRKDFDDPVNMIKL
jgi:NADH:ubiquinone oxidoreductase subunit C